MADQKHLVVIDDSPWNIASAKLTLADHRLTVFDDLGKAFDFIALGWLRLDQVDAVLTDLMMPVGGLTECKRPVDFLVKKHAQATDIIPAGLALAWLAAMQGVKSVIVSDLNHHHGVIPTMLEEGQKRVEDHCLDMGASLVSFVRADYVELVGKDWDEDARCLVDRKEDSEPNLDRTVKNWLSAARVAGIFPPEEG